VPELLFDPLGRRHVLLAPERARRGAPKVESFRPDPEPCDFCGGQEQRTPPETYSIRHDGSAPDAPGWSVRSVPNLYPATQVHEVVVHTPHHHVRYETQSRSDQLDVIQAYRDRLRVTDTPSVVVVWNRGRASGASRSHAHGQIFGLETVPPTLERETEALAEGPCVLCQMATEESLQIDERDGFRVIAHRVPFVANEVLIVPPHGARMSDLDDDALGIASDAFASAVRRLSATLGDGVPFNLVIHTAPRGVDHFHWHAHLMPRTATWGGLEMGAELPIVASDPHDTAFRFRADAF
jgi:UDPglucose--hexose-1-phosphate uridylyltransferase